MCSKKKFLPVSWHKNCDGLADLHIYTISQTTSLFFALSHLWHRKVKESKNCDARAPISRLRCPSSFSSFPPQDPNSLCVFHHFRPPSFFIRFSRVALLFHRPGTGILYLYASTLHDLNEHTHTYSYIANRGYRRMKNRGHLRGFYEIFWSCGLALAYLHVRARHELASTNTHTLMGVCIDSTDFVTAKTRARISCKWRTAAAAAFEGLHK